MDPQVLAASCWIEAPLDGNPVSDVSVRFTGTRYQPGGLPGELDRFEQVATAPAIPRGAGRLAITARVHHLSPGRWDVRASTLNGTALPTWVPPHNEHLRTQFGPFAYGPGVHLWAWPALIGIGAVVALALQALLVARGGGDAGVVVGISVLSCLLGFAGGKLWYALLHKRSLRTLHQGGACIQGFLLVAFAVLAGGAWLTGQDLAATLDATAPAVFVGMAIGRPGCFLTGCCAGRPTASRWGLWASDRRVAVRRVPVQLIEASAAALIAVASLAVTFAVSSPYRGGLFVATVAAYTIVRQWLFGFRSDPHTGVGRIATVVICLAVLAADILWLVPH
ncbi:prolipoprotein diacylglyceryl transferase [Skermania sp. ID1734]|uniref:prolipoprotein diacylglyceryl transferase family protein n=1 Tax=Skermania sp. ID1734 TaxID=2597516 RepID=UPI0011805232|nr:prolipoprotein diacylglyceryl transferase family protein [Skermania sp. ID1734]TSD93795.1 prolipoprotein diacylglyceryl transferase [Skermania sp. ID1734]